MTTLPIIDFAGVRSGDSAATAKAAHEIHAACIGPGFFYLRNHGIADAGIDRAAAAARDFFHLPGAKKAEVKANANHRGFHAMGDALMYGAKKPDLKEFYSIGLELPVDDPAILAGEPLRGANNWPAFMPELQAALYPFYEAMGECGGALLRTVALSLGLAADFFVPRYRKRLQRTQIIYYPPQPPAADDEQFGVAPHTDYGCITLLWQDDSGGLQVRERASRSWIEAPPIPGTFVVNVGDLLARWTNDRFSSTPHRVINRSGGERFSIATFYDPDFAALVDPRELGTPEAECHYPPVRAGEHILKRFDQSFGYRKKLKAGAA
jgi:isopenicillin N synthase-like dioxygenase